MIKILHLAESANGGGAESVFRDTVLKLIENNTENQHFVACIAEGREPFPITLDFKKNRQNKLGQIFSFKNYRSLKIFFKTFQPDIIHIQNYGNLSPSILKAVLEYKSSRTAIKVVQTVHTFEYVCSHHAAFDYRRNKRCTDCATHRFKFKIFYRGCSRLGYLHSWAKGITSLIANYYLNQGLIDTCITPSEFLKYCMATEKNVKVLRNPMSESFLEQKFDLKTQKDDHFEFIYFGRFSEEKNLEVLVDAFALVVKSDPKARLVMIGRGDQREALIRQCDILGISSSVEFIEFLPSNILVKRLKRGHVSVLASKCFETASLVINEAVMCQLIPIVSNHGAMKETLQILGAGLNFNSESCQDLSNRMKDSMIDYKLYYSQLEKSFDIIQECYSSKKYIEGLLDIYTN